MPVREVGRLVAVDDPDARAAVIGWHLARLEVRRTRSAATTVAAVRDVLDLADVLAWYDHAMGEIGDALVRVGAVPSGPPGGLYDNALFTDERGEALVYVPVATRPPTARLLRTSSPPLRWRRPCTPAPHDDIDVTYATLGSYLSSHALPVAGPVREIYHVGPRDTDDSSLWRTEIGWPIFQAAPDR